MEYLAGILGLGVLAVWLALWRRHRRRRKAQELYHDAVEQQARERRKPTKE